MSTEDLKRLLHESIENIDDAEFLLVIKEMLDRKYTHLEEPKLSYKQKKRMEQARKDIAKGDYMTNEEADQLVEKWLKE